MTCGHVMDVQSVWIKIADLMILQVQVLVSNGMYNTRECVCIWFVQFTCY